MFFFAVVNITLFFVRPCCPIPRRWHGEFTTRWNVAFRTPPVSFFFFFGGQKGKEISLKCIANHCNMFCAATILAPEPELLQPKLSIIGLASTNTDPSFNFWRINKRSRFFGVDRNHKSCVISLAFGIWRHKIDQNLSICSAHLDQCFYPFLVGIAAAMAGDWASLIAQEVRNPYHRLSRQRLKWHGWLTTIYIIWSIMKYIEISYLLCIYIYT